MASKRRIGKAERAARAARSNQYLRRLIEDEALRNNLLDAYGAARKAAGRVNHGKPTAKSLMSDKKLQRELKHAADSLKDVSNALKQGPKKRRRRRAGGFTGILVVMIVGAGGALALSEGLRSKVLDLLFGAEEEFDYSSTTTPATEAPTSVGASGS